MIETESHAVLNTLTEYDIQDAFKIGKNTGNGMYALKGTTSWVVVANRPKFSF
jgi:hypothetical protein